MKKLFLTLLCVICSIVILSGCKDESNGYRRRRSSHRQSIFSAARLRAARASSISNLKQLSCLMIMYSDDNDGWMPESPDLLFIPGYLDNTGILIAPFDLISKKAEIDHLLKSRTNCTDLITPENTSYAWVIPDSSKIYQQENPFEIPIIFEKPWILPPETDLISVAYADGHVMSVTIPGVSEMSCRQAAEHLTMRIADKNLRQRIISKAAEEDFYRNRHNVIDLRLVKQNISAENVYLYRNNAEFAEHTQIVNGKPVTYAYLIEKKPLLSIIQPKNARLIKEYGQIQLLVELNDEDKYKFSHVTAANIGRQVAVFIGDKLYCAPVITEKIDGGQVTISGISMHEAEDIVDRLSGKSAKKNKNHFPIIETIRNFF